MASEKYHGFDTETVEGYAKIIATEKEYQYVHDFDDIIHFLRKNTTYGSIFWTWNLRFDAQAIIKYLGKELGKKLYDAGFDGVDLDQCHITYIPNRMLKFKFKDKHWVKMYDMAQFYSYKSLDSQAMQYLRKKKQDNSNWVEQCVKYQDNEISVIKLIDYFNTHINEIGKYCQRDAMLTKELAEYMRNKFVKAGYDFRDAFSQARIAEKHIKCYSIYPKIPSAINDFHDFAQASYHGGIFETLQRGYIEKDLYDYDINSAYPCTLASLPHWANGEFIEITEPDKTNVVKYGWYLCEFDCKWIPYELDQPQFVKFLYGNKKLESKMKINNNTIIYPAGKRKQVITKSEYDFLKKYKYPCIFFVGIEWRQNKDKWESPFGWIPTAYKTRQRIKRQNPDGVVQQTHKIVMNSAYGKTAQYKRGKGRLTNFFYASYVTADTRMKIAEVVERNKDYVVEIATDGLILTRKDHTLPISDDIGDWSEKQYTKGLFLGSGIRQLWKNDNNYITHARGITNKRDWDMLAVLTKNKRKSALEYTKIRPLNLGEILLFNKVLCWEDLNTFQPVTKMLDVNTDKKHVWPEPLKNFGHLLRDVQKAKAININEKQTTMEDF